MDLEALRSHPENGPLLVRVSGIIRRHATLAFSLPPGEMTTAEFAKSLQSSKAPSDLSSTTIQFLRQCDERKFSAKPPPPQSSIVDTALDLLDEIEKAKVSVSAATASVPDAVPANPS